LQLAHLKKVDVQVFFKAELELLNRGVRICMYDLIQIDEDFFCAAYVGSSWPTSSNIFIIADANGLTLIDTGTDNPNCFSSLSSCLEKTGYGVKNVHTILLTHGHPDHIGGTNAICRHAKPRILISEASIPEAVDLSQQDYYCLPPQVRAIAPHLRHFDLIDNFRRTCGSWELEERPLIGIQDGAVLKIGRYALQTIHTPGHDIGLMCFLIRIIRFSFRATCSDHRAPEVRCPGTHPRQAAWMRI
jgi:glyoxylase-like metal-dependent hydrolase (beta-lactamase superfamily II)